MENNKELKSYYSEDQIDLTELFQVIWSGKWFVLALTTVFSITSIFYSLSLPNIYISKALIIPVQQNDSISSSLNSYSGLAALAGVSLPSQSSKSNQAKAIEKLQSLSFFESNILPNIFLPELMALESWDSKNNKLIFNDTIYNSVKDTWVKNPKDPEKTSPSIQESYIKFLDHLSIEKEDYTGFIELQVRHKSPYIAKEWASLLVTQINKSFRANDKEHAKKALDYLNSEIAKTNLNEIKQVLAQLMQQEIQKLTLIEANDAYVFDYIDPPAVMERKAEPNRSIICILGAILGAIIGNIIVLIRHYFFKNNIE